MGTLRYGENQKFAFDDRTLTHLRTVMMHKVTQQESFAFTWIDDDRQRTIWIHPGVELQFEFDDESTPALNKEWVEKLLTSANSSQGLRLVDEPKA